MQSWSQRQPGERGDSETLQGMVGFGEDERPPASEFWNLGAVSKNASTSHVLIEGLNLLELQDEVRVKHTFMFSFKLQILASIC